MNFPSKKVGLLKVPTVLPDQKELITESQRFLDKFNGSPLAEITTKANGGKPIEYNQAFITDISSSFIHIMIDFGKDSFMLDLRHSYSDIVSAACNQLEKSKPYLAALDLPCSDQNVYSPSTVFFVLTVMKRYDDDFYTQEFISSKSASKSLIRIIVDFFQSVHGNGAKRLKPTNLASLAKEKGSKSKPLVIKHTEEFYDFFPYEQMYGRPSPTGEILYMFKASVAQRIDATDKVVILVENEYFDCFQEITNSDHDRIFHESEFMNAGSGNFTIHDGIVDEYGLPDLRYVTLVKNNKKTTSDESTASFPVMQITPLLMKLEFIRQRNDAMRDECEDED